MTSLKICSLGSINLDFIVQTHCLPTAGKTIGGGLLKHTQEVKVLMLH